MSELNKLLEEMLHDQRERTHTTILCRIESYDPIEMKADLQPLVKEYYDKSGKGEYEHVELEPIKGASVSCIRAGEKHIIRPPYKEGDVVLAVCAERSIDEVIETGEISEQTGRRRHSLQDALVIGGVTTNPDPMPEEHADDLLIAKLDGDEIKTRIVLTDEEDSILIAKGDSGGYDASITIEENSNVDVFSKNDITAHAEGNVSVTADGNITIAASGTLTLTGNPIVCNGCSCPDA